MSKPWLLLVLALTLACNLPAAAAEQGPPPAVTQAADAWLSLVDQGRYGRSWRGAATYFQKAVAKTQWRDSLRGVRTPLGSVVRRELMGAQSASQLPGAPDGRYWVLQYATRFTAKAEAVETLTLMADGERGWRVSGYFIK